MLSRDSTPRKPRRRNVWCLFESSCQERDVAYAWIQREILCIALLASSCARCVRRALAACGSALRDGGAPSTDGAGRLYVDLGLTPVQISDTDMAKRAVAHVLCRLTLPEGQCRILLMACVKACVKAILRRVGGEGGRCSDIDGSSPKKGLHSLHSLLSGLSKRGLHPDDDVDEHRGVERQRKLSS